MDADGHATVNGFVAPGFEVVRDVFADNFTSRGEVGAAFAAVHDGEAIVDLWAGVADETTGRPWERDTTQPIFSGTKSLVALCLLMLIDRGRLSLDAPVARYWPEFAVNGKQRVRVHEIASHRARMPRIHQRLVEDDVLDDRRMATLLAAQPLETDPRARDTYHALTFGWLCGELIRRIDGRSIGRFVAEEIARPLDLRLWIGLPPGEEPSVARVCLWGLRKGTGPHDVNAARDELAAGVFRNPILFPEDGLPWNRPDWHRAEIPAGGAIGTARSLARLHGCLALGGELDGVRLLSQSTLRAGRRELTRRRDPLLGIPMAFGTGFQLQTELRTFGPPSDAFGHAGAGGSVHCAWPSERVGLSYAPNALGDADPDPRAASLLGALYDAARRA